MKVVILAGGRGSRLSEETDIKPKPMVEVGGRPLLWHIMQHYSHHGFNEFVIALGYRGDVIKRYIVDCCRPKQRPHHPAAQRRRDAPRDRRKDGLDR
jgi:glucose-1-phosphate cytidylyltransferase